MTRINDLKNENIAKIRKCFYNMKIWTKNQISNETHLSLATATNILQYLLKNNEIKFIGEAASTGGRKSKQYLINKDYHHIGMIVLKRDGNEYYFCIKIVNLMNDVLFEEVIQSDGSIDDFKKCMKNVMKDYLIHLLIISIPGVCHRGLIDICDFCQFQNFNLGDYIESLYNVTYVIENDVNIAAIGLSYYYPDIHHLSLIYQPKAEYVGCGIIIDNKLYNGFSHFAGELRYLPFYTHQQQDELLKNDPEGLLINQIMTLVCVLNPELIGVCSDVINCIDKDKLQKNILDRHMPDIIQIDDMDHMIFLGMYTIAIKKLSEER